MEGAQGVPSLILILDTRRTLVYNFTLRSLYPGKEFWCPLIGGSVGHRANLDVSVYYFKQKNLPIKKLSLAI